MLLVRSGDMDEMTRKLVRLYKKANNAVESGVDKLCEIADKYDPRKDGSNGEEIIIHGTKTNINSSPFFILKNHNCPNCCSLLIKKKREKVVNSFSEEAKNYDFFSFDSYLVGNIKFITYYFECPDCKTIFELDELVKFEKSENKTKRKEKIEALKAKIQKRIRK